MVAPPILSPNNGQSLPLKSNGLLTTSDKTVTTPLAISVAETNDISPAVAATAAAKLTSPAAAFTTATAGADKEDSNLDAELLALAAQQMRSPTSSMAHTPTPNMKAVDAKCNPAKWSVSSVRLHIGVALCF